MNFYCSHCTVYYTVLVPYKQVDWINSLRCRQLQTYEPLRVLCIYFFAKFVVGTFVYFKKFQGDCFKNLLIAWALCWIRTKLTIQLTIDYWPSVSIFIATLPFISFEGTSHKNRLKPALLIRSSGRTNLSLVLIEICSASYKKMYNN